MGIKGIKSLIKKHVPSAISEIKLSDLRGKVVCIDSSILLYKFRYTYQDDNFHIIGFLNKIIELQLYGIKVIFVFDGKPPEAKRETLNKRKETKLKQKEQLNTLKTELGKFDLNVDEFIDSDSDENNVNDNIIYFKEIKNKIKSLEKNIKTVSKFHSTEVMEMLKSIGIPFFDSDGEAEEACVFLQTNGYADYILTEDTDSLTFGGTNIIFTKKDCYFVCYLDLVLKGFGINQDEFIDLCILCGCDYTCTIPKIGPVNALKLIIKHRSIENLPIPNLPETFDYITARKLFKCGIDIKEINFNLNQDKNKFVEILSKYGIQENYFINKLKINSNFCNFNFNLN